MLFNSLTFLLLFLPLCLILYYAAGRINRHWAEGVLVLFSFIFYSWWAPWLLILLAASIAYNYLFGMAILRTENRERLQNWILFVAIMGNLALLFNYKYLYPLLTWLDSVGWHIPRQRDSIVLPMGISFFTFTQIGYLVDCKAGIAKGGKLLDYILFVIFFPHLIAGPILHHREMMPQFSNPESYRFKVENFGVGLTIFIMGLAKKVLVADHFAPVVANVFKQPENLGAITAWGGVLSYAIQLYFDFSGYCEMATGLALLFGFRFPANFNSPYKSLSIIDYWQRWHMTLTRYLTLYLYNPAALWVTRLRQEQGKPIAREGASTAGGFLSMIAMPTFFTMLLAGIWHGAGLQFFIFGALHASYLTINQAWRVWGPGKAKDASWVNTGVNALWKITLTMLAVLVADVFFRSTSAQAAFVLLRDMVGAHGALSPEAPKYFQLDVVETIFHDHGYDMSGWLQQHMQFGAPLTLLVAYIWVFTMPNILELTAAYKPVLTKISPPSWPWLAWKPNLAWGCILGAMAAIAVLAVTGTTEFLYFKF